MKFRILIILLILPFSSWSQIIETYAGGGSDGLGDGGMATSASIGYFAGMALDTNGNLYIADGNNNRIRKIDTSGIITTIAGNGTAGFSGDSDIATEAELNEPQWVAVDKNGNIYISDNGNDRIRKITSGTNIISTITGNGVEGFSGDSGLAIEAMIYGPQGITVDDDGNLYFADAGNNRIRKIDTLGIITTIAGNGFEGYAGDGGIADTAEFNELLGIRVDKSHNLYIADWHNDRVRKLNTETQNIVTVAGNGNSVYTSDSTIAISTGIDPFDVAADDLGNLFVADFNNNRIRKISPSGIIYTVAGNGTGGFSGDGGSADSAQIHGPEGVVIDRCDNIYIADFGNERVRKVTYDSCITIPTTAVNKVQSSSKITIYPNPAQNTLTITGSSIQQITISNMLGQTVFTQSYHTQKAQINIANLPQGLYFVKVNDAFVQKVVKE